MRAESLRLQRTHRLRASRDFRRVSRRGKRMASRYFVIQVAPGEVDKTGFVRLGLTVSRRVGNAVVRNRVKRRVREWFRHRRENLGDGVDLVVIARPEAGGLSYHEMARDLDALVAGYREKWIR